MHNYGFLIAKKKSQVQGLQDQIKSTKRRKKGKFLNSALFFSCGCAKNLL